MGILSQASSSHMNSDTAALPGGSPANPQPPKPGGAWLGSQSVFDTRDERKLGRAMGASMMIHGGIFLALILAVTVAPQQSAQLMQDLKVVFLSEAGPGGGGGGSPAPAPKKPMEIPKAKPPEPIPVVTPPPPPPVEQPVPTLNTPIQTNAAVVVQAAGTSTISLAQYGGGGRGTGIGPGTGNGVGPGTGGGFGGGAFRPGSGINNPAPIKSVQPKYTSEAMRAKIQGSVEIEAVVLPNGTIGDVRILKPLDKQYGLDQEAIVAAKQWLFRPGTDKDGKPIPVIVTIILEFRLH